MLEERFRNAKIPCELTHLPGTLVIGRCDIGIRLLQGYNTMTADIIRYQALPGVRLFQEIVNNNQITYAEIAI